MKERTLSIALWSDKERTWLFCGEVHTNEVTSDVRQRYATLLGAPLIAVRVRVKPC